MTADVRRNQITYPQYAYGLKVNCLSFGEILAQSLAVIAPTTIPASNLGLIVALAGNGAWLSFGVGLIGLLLVSLSINQFASRSTSPGSLYAYTVTGLGPIAGVMCGWSLVLAYLFTGMSVLCGFANIGGSILGHLGIDPASTTLLAIGAGIAWYAAYRDVQMSAMAMLWMEGISIVLILILGILIWAAHGFALDWQQLRLVDVQPSQVAMGLVLVMFSFSGFESPTSLGSEARRPLKNIPKAVIASVLMAGIFFIFMCYVEMLGFNRSGLDLAHTEEPLRVLARQLGVGWLGDWVALGALLSFFACVVGSINPAARIMFMMARHGLFHGAIGHTHDANCTPHLAVTVCSLLMFLVPAGMSMAGAQLFDSMGYLGAMASYGFLTVYILVSIAAPVYLYRLGRLRWWHLLNAIGSVSLMMIPVLGSVGIAGSTIFPVPDAPYYLFPYLFASYLGITCLWFLYQRRQNPHLLKQIHLTR